MSKKMKTFHEEVIYIPWFGDIHIHLDDNDEPLRIYVYVDDLKKASSDFEYLDDKDEKIFCDPRKYENCKNPPFVHLKQRYVNRVFTGLNLKDYIIKE